MKDQIKDSYAIYDFIGIIGVILLVLWICLLVMTIKTGLDQRINALEQANLTSK